METLVSRLAKRIAEDLLGSKSHLGIRIGCVLQSEYCEPGKEAEFLKAMEEIRRHLLELRD